MHGKICVGCGSLCKTKSYSPEKPVSFHCHVLSSGHSERSLGHRELFDLLHSLRKNFYDIFFAAASAALSETLANPRWLGATTNAFTMILHMGNQRLNGYALPGSPEQRSQANSRCPPLACTSYSERAVDGPPEQDLDGLTLLRWNRSQAGSEFVKTERTPDAAPLPGSNRQKIGKLSNK